MAINNNAFELSNTTTITQKNPVKETTPIFVDYKNKTTSHESKSITSRSCDLAISQTKIITKLSCLLLQTISMAFENSKLNQLICTNDGCTLPLIYSETNHCFFKTCSKNIQTIIIDYNISTRQKIAALDETIRSLPLLRLSSTQNYIAENFLSSISNCLLLTDDFNDAIVWQQLKGNKFVDCYVNNKEICQMQNVAIGKIKPYLPIDLLFIEPESRFIADKKNLRQIDLGRHTFDNEWFYMERCYRGFLFLLNKQIKSIDNINFIDLSVTNAILGGKHNARLEKGVAFYGCNVPSNYGDKFIRLVKTGVICDSEFSYTNDQLSVEERMAELQEFLQKSFSLNIKLKQIVLNHKSYFIIDSTDNTTLSASEENHEALLDDLQGKTENKAFLFKIHKKNDKNKKKYPLDITIGYCYKQDRKEVCQQLLDIYYKKLRAKSMDSKQKIILAIELCAMMQRIHPFADGNGRTLFFILFPILLYQMGLWLTKMVSQPWHMLDFHKTEELADKIISLCVPAPIFKNIISTWNRHITKEEILRISCASGDIDELLYILINHPRLIHQPISISPISPPVTILEYAIIIQQEEILAYLLDFFYKNKLNYEITYKLLKLCETYNFKKGIFIIAKSLDREPDTIKQ